MWQVEVSHKSEMADPFNRGDTLINKHFTLLFCTCMGRIKEGDII